MTLRLRQIVVAISLSSALALAAAKTPPGLRGFQVPLVFEANRGQAVRGVRFLARGSGYSLLLKDDGAVLRLPSSELRMGLAGSRPAKNIEALDPQPGTSSYFVGNDQTKWRTGIPQSGRVRYSQVYPGIDLVFKSAASSRFEYDFVVAPAADPSKIAVRFDGAQSIESDGDGGIILHTTSGEIRQPRPNIYQDLESGRREVPGRMVLGKGKAIHFDLGAYDHSRALIIDPIVAVYLNGSVDDLFGGIARDSAGNIYVTGSTASPDFPLGNVIGNPSPQGSHQLFVSKLSPDLSKFYYSVIIGGRATSNGNGIQVDSAGNAYVVGTTFASDFPTVNAAQSTFGDKDVTDQSLASDAFILKLDPKGATLIYSTFLAGDGADTGVAIAVDKTGAAYATGAMRSFHSFPNTSGAIRIGPFVYGGLTIPDVWAAKMSPDGRTFDYVASFGGSTISQSVGISLDNGGNAYVTGYVYKAGPDDFPIVGNVVQPSRRGDSCDLCISGFVSKLTPDGSAFAFSTYFGGSGSDKIQGLALDAGGNIYIVGITSSLDMPVTPGVVGPTALSNSTAFVAALNNSGSAVVACSYLGGTTTAVADAVIVRAPGVIGIAGGGALDYVGFPLNASGLGGVYLELDPLFKTVSRADPPERVVSDYPGLAAAPDGSVALGGATMILPNSAGQLAPTNRNAVVVVSASAPKVTISLVTLTGATNPATVTAGSNFSYVFTVSNTSAAAITNLKLTTTFSGAAVQVTKGSISSGYCPLFSPSAPFPCIDATLAAGATTALTITGAAVEVGTAQATASLTWDGGTTQTANVSANVTSPQGNLQFAAPVTASTVSGPPVAVAVSMGNVFLLTTNVEIFSGAALSTQPNVALASGTPAGVIAVDFNADGAADLAVLDTAADAITTYLATSPGYAQTQTFTTGVTSTAVAMLNLTGTPGSGMVAIGANGIALFTSNGDGTFNPGAVFDVPGRQGNLVAVAAGGFTGVGFDDLVVADAAGEIWLIPSDGMGGYGNPIMTQADANPVAFAVGDFNGDGYLDLAVANSGSADISLLLGDGAGNFGTATNFPVGSGPIALAAMDFDGDGNLDLAVAVNGTNTVALLRGDGAGGFGTPLQYAVGPGPVAIAVGDVDGDGMPDIAVASGKAPSVSVLLNQNVPQQKSGRKGAAGSKN
jgi:hypothetical protein